MKIRLNSNPPPIIVKIRRYQPEQSIFLQRFVYELVKITFLWENNIVKRA